ncbi:hypothetical protein BVIET440_230098 [Burkholderia vietnamiensis]|nr:hypothetical protein BVI1335_1540039 [Burkholderia vietnamiensis]
MLQLTLCYRYAKNDITPKTAHA